MGENLETPQGETSAQPQGIAEQAKAEEENYFEKIVGEGKTYSDPNKLAKSKLDADRKIEEQKAEIVRLQEVAQKAKTTDEILQALQQKETPAETNEQVPASLTPDDLEKWYQEREQKAQEDARIAAEVQSIKRNQDKAWELLSSEEAFGSKEAAKRAMAQYMGDDETKVEIINQMGGRDPEALVTFLKAAVPKEKVNFSSDDGTVTPPNDYSKLGDLTWDKVKAMEKDNPKLRNDRKFQQYVTTHVKI
jgi:hypothetical protein